MGTGNIILELPRAIRGVFGLSGDRCNSLWRLQSACLLALFGASVSTAANAHWCTCNFMDEPHGLSAEERIAGRLARTEFIARGRIVRIGYDSSAGMAASSTLLHFDIEESLKGNLTGRIALISWRDNADCGLSDWLSAQARSQRSVILPLALDERRRAYNVARCAIPHQDAGAGQISPSWPAMLAADGTFKFGTGSTLQLGGK